jgi:hypothetical protein
MVRTEVDPDASAEPGTCLPACLFSFGEIHCLPLKGHPRKAKNSARHKQMARLNGSEIIDIPNANVYNGGPNR